MTGRHETIIKKLEHILYRCLKSFNHQNRKMAKKFVGCIGKCTSGLTTGELDLITDHIYKTLTHSKGRQIFRKFLEQGERMDDLTCLDFYDKVSEIIERDRVYRDTTEEPSVEILRQGVSEALDIAADLDAVPEIDLALLERVSESLESPHGETMLEVLRETKSRLINHLRNSHRDFKVYLLEPCPKTSK